MDGEPLCFGGVRSGVWGCDAPASISYFASSLKLCPKGHPVVVAIVFVTIVILAMGDAMVQLRSCDGFR